MQSVTLCTVCPQQSAACEHSQSLACSVLAAAPVDMGESVKQALKEAERAAKKQKLCVDVSASSISSTLRNLTTVRAQVCQHASALRHATR